MIPKHIEEIIQNHLEAHEQPERIAISTKYPSLAGIILFLKCTSRSFRDSLDPLLSRSISLNYFNNVVCRHQSVLFRRLGDSDPRLQRQKVINLEKAVRELNGLVISPGRKFSFWHVVGKPEYQKGYVDGMLLANGKVVEGVGGGLCQLSNLLYWLLLHAPLTIIERHRHAYDVFPDSGRVLPFGSGATIMYNTIDLRAVNNTDVAFQLKLWITDKHLKGQVLSTTPIEFKYHIYEKYHCFVGYKGRYYRFNEIWRKKTSQGQTQNDEFITRNFAPLMYEVNERELKQRGFHVWHMD